MRAHINNLVLLLRPPGVKPGAAIQRPSWLLSSSRKLHSDAPSVAPAAVKTVPAEEARPPLTDLLGRRHNYLRISLTERCNLRCKYCMPAEGVPLSPKQALLSRGELARVVQVFAALGVDKVRLTGGEPTVRADLADIVQDISSIEGIRSVSMTTNGLVLTRRLPALQRAGLAHLNVSLDSLRADRYELMARRPGLARVLAGIDLALQLGYRPVKINTVLMRGFNDDEICDFVEFTRDREVEVRFIEFMPFSGNAWDDSKLVPHLEAVRALCERHPDARPCLPRPNDTARVWQVPGYVGSVGFISSMTKNFCATCNRLRLTADGNLKVCLFGNAEVSLRDALRAGACDQQLEALVRAALRNKKPQHAESRPNGEPTNDTNRGVTASRARAYQPQYRDVRTFTARRRRPPTLVPARGPATAAATLTTSPIYPTVSLAPIFAPRYISARAYSTQAGDDDGGDPVMTHLDARGRARMVDVGDKAVTSRTAAAQCSLRVGGRLLRLLKDAHLPKGDALTVAQVAGVVGAKKTAELIPLCHSLPLDCVRVNIRLPKGECVEGGDIRVECEVRATARTGAEMEALTGAAVAALALYDMCKSVDRGMQVTDLRVVRKEGGRSGAWPRPAPPPVQVREHDTSPVKPREMYAPTDLMHF